MFIGKLPKHCSKYGYLLYILYWNGVIVADNGIALLADKLYG